MPDEHDRTGDAWAGRNHPSAGPRSGDSAPPDPTRQMPKVAGGDAWNSDSGPNAVWAGRAQVRAPRPESAEWAVPAEEEPRGRWWMPILVGLIVLVLLGLLGWAVWLIVRSAGPDSPEAPVPAVTRSAEAPRTTRPATTAPPATTTASAEPEEPETVVVPALRGMSRDEATQALDRRGLTYRLIFRNSDAADGTVIDSDPAEGQEVPENSQVTLVIARARTTAPPTVASSSPATTETDPETED